MTGLEMGEQSQGNKGWLAAAGGHGGAGSRQRGGRQRQGLTKAPNKIPTCHADAQQQAKRGGWAF